jgi:hypothetical protein
MRARAIEVFVKMFKSPVEFATHTRLVRTRNLLRSMLAVNQPEGLLNAHVKPEIIFVSQGLTLCARQQPGDPLVSGPKHHCALRLIDIEDRYRLSDKRPQPICVTCAGFGDVPAGGEGLSALLASRAK